MPRFKELLPRDYSSYLDACNLARTSDYSTRCGAVASVGRKRISGAFNSFRSVPSNTIHGHATFHAEHNCMVMVPDRFVPKVTLHIARLGKDGHPLPSAPCRRCRSELEFLQVPELVYMNQEGIIVKEVI